MLSHRLLLLLLIACGDTEPTTPAAVTPPAPLLVNEIMAKNLFTISDETGATPDWVEIYNRTDALVDLAGYSITNNLEQPTKHVFRQLLIAPKGHLLLWADGQPELGDRHLLFGLTKAGEIGLFAPSGTALDIVTFTSLETDWVAARQPDGADAWVVTLSATPGEANGAP